MASEASTGFHTARRWRRGVTDSGSVVPVEATMFLRQQKARLGEGASPRSIDESIWPVGTGQDACMDRVWLALSCEL
jgi:hypothetical protein